MHATPKWYLPVAILALLWNLVGCWAYLQDVMVTPEDVARMSADLQALRAARPMWSVAATAVGVWAGAAGCIGLILRRRWAVPLLIASLLGVILQDISLFALGRSVAHMAQSVYILQGMVLAISIALVVFGRRAAARDWIG
jgi:hypothetical protein